MKKFTSLVLTLALCLGVSVLGTGQSKAAIGELILNDSSLLTIDRESGYITGIAPGSTVAEVAANFNTTAYIKIYKGDDELPLDSIVASDCFISNGDDELKCAVMGDVNCDGNITVTDVLTMLKHISGWGNSLCTPAFDVNYDGKLDVSDAIILLKYIANWGVSLAPYKVVYSEEVLTAKYEDPSLKLSVLDNMQKVDQLDTDIGSNPTILMNMAKNEIESCLIYLASDTQRNDLTVTCTDFSNGRGDKLETELTLGKYVFGRSIESEDVKVRYADPMIPNMEFKIKAGNSQCLLLKAKSAIDAKAGLYESTVSVKDADGREIKTCKVYAQVWNFALPEETSCDTAFGLDRYTLYSSYPGQGGDDGLLYAKYYEYLLENRISAYFMPYEVYDERADKYMSNPRVTSFCVDGSQNAHDLLSDEKIVASYNKLTQNSVWAEKAYFYYVDEPRTTEDFQNIEYYCERLDRLYPGARQVAPNCYNFNMSYYGVGDPSLDQAEFLMQNTTLFCPLSSFYTPLDKITSDVSRITYSNGSVSRFGTAEERHAAYKAEGNDLWWYVCIIPGYPYANFFYNYQGEMSRVLFWQQYDYDITGCLYYLVNYWTGSEWMNIDQTALSGDGLLLYSGKRYNTTDPIESLRLEYVRDGIEDFEYLTMAEKLVGRDAVNEILATVTTGILDYTTDSNVIEEAKARLAEIIVQNS